MTLFALRRKRDRVFMPDFAGKAGGTHVDPDDPKTHTGKPRLFVSKRAAHDALRWWASGKHSQYMGDPFDIGNVTLYRDPVNVTTVVEGRSVIDWEVVPVQLIVVAETIE